MRTHVEKSKKYELDKYLIKKIYNKEEKKKRIYKVTKKNVVYDKQLTEQYFKYSNNNRNSYYSSYQSFRDYISSGYNYDFLVNEINNVKSILGFSKNIRELINKRMTQESLYSSSFSNSFKNQNQIVGLNEEPFNPRINIPKEDPLSKLKQSYAIPPKNEITRRASTVFQIDKENPYIKRVADFAHKNIQLNTNFPPPVKKDGKKDFLEICKLLKTKEEEIKRPQNQYQFRLYSVMAEDFDPFFLPVYENFMKVKYENQKTKLLKLYNQENGFIKCVTIIKEKLKSHLMKDNQNQNNNNFLKLNRNIGFQTFPKHKFQFKIPYINAFYFGRIEIFFKDIDNFMSMYKENTDLSTKKLEKDFFSNLFKILTYNNSDCKKFLQYLYSHSYFFKYIYNYFTLQDKNAGMTIKNFAPSIKRNKEEEPLLNESMKKLFKDSKSQIEDVSKLTIKKEKEDFFQKTNIDINNLDFIDTLLGNEFVYTISLCEDDIADIINNKKIEEFKEILSNNNRFIKDYIITLNNNENNNLLQIINVKGVQKAKSNKKTSLKNKNFIFSFPLDNRIIFYDLQKDLKRTIKIEKEKTKKDKYILVCLKNEEDEYSQSYVFIISKDLFKRFKKSNALKDKISSKEIFREKEGSEDEKIQFNYDEDKKEKKEEVFGFNEHTSDDNESENDSEKKKTPKGSKINFMKRTQNRALTFGIGKNPEEQVNDSDKNKEEDEEDSDNKKKNDNQDSSEEAKESKESDEGDEEDKEDSDEKDKDSDEKDKDSDEKDSDDEDKDSDDEDKDSDEDDKNNDDKKKKEKESSDEKSDENKGENSSDFLNKNNNEETINTNVNKIVDDEED